MDEHQRDIEIELADETGRDEAEQDTEQAAPDQPAPEEPAPDQLSTRSN